MKFRSHLILDNFNCLLHLFPVESFMFAVTMHSWWSVSVVPAWYVVQLKLHPLSYSVFLVCTSSIFCCFFETSHWFLVVMYFSNVTDLLVILYSSSSYQLLKMTNKGGIYWDITRFFAVVYKHAFVLLPPMLL